MAVAGLSVQGAALADVIHDESIDGDLSSDNLNPTFLNAAFENNEVIGSTIPTPIDRDFFTITVDPGFELTAILFQLYDTTEDQSFFAVQEGSQVSDLNDPSMLLGTALIGGNPGNQQGDDVLDDLGNAFLGGTGFTGPLGEGTYTFWFQETAANVNYEFNFVVNQIPEPGSLALLGAGAVGLVLRRRR